MVTRRPLVLISGQQTELPPGDSLLGVSIGSLSVSSGLSGGGDLSGNTTTFVAVAPNPSGVIFVGDKLALDGSALRQGQAALASGNYALEVGNQALTSGVIANSVANAALASGNAVLTAIPQIPNGVLKHLQLLGVSKLVTQLAWMKQVPCRLWALLDIQKDVTYPVINK